MSSNWLMGFLARFYRAPARDRAFIRSLAELRADPDADDNIEFPDDANPLSQYGYEAMVEMDKLTEDEVIFVLQKLKYAEAKRNRGKPGSMTLAKIGWLQDPILRNRDLVLGSTLELHEEGSESVRVQMLSDLLSRAQREVTNTTSYVHSLANQALPLVKIVSENAGRHGLAFKLTDAGTTEAKSLREKSAGKRASKAT